MRVLIACEFSGVVREAFRKKGHNAWSCDLLPSDDNSMYHIQGDILTLLEEGIHGVPEEWDLMIAHPPCTYLTVSGLHWNKHNLERAQKTVEAIQFVKALLDAPVERIALENPVGCLSTTIRKPDQIIQPYQFGEDASKKTCLWLKNLEPLKIDPEKRFPGRWVVTKNGTLKERWSNQTDEGQNRLGPSEDRWKLRSITYQGIADAMAEQWG